MKSGNDDSGRGLLVQTRSSRDGVLGVSVVSRFRGLAGLPNRIDIIPGLGISLAFSQASVAGQ